MNQISTPRAKLGLKAVLKNSLSLLAIVGAIYVVFQLSEEIAPFVSQYVLIRVHPEAQPILSPPILSVVISFIVVVLAVLQVLLSQLRAYRRLVTKTQSILGETNELLRQHSPERMKAIEDTLTEMMENARRISRQVNGDENKPRVTFEEVTYRYEIRENGDAFVHRHFKIRAPKEPVVCWQISIFADDEAPAVQSLVELDFQIEHRGGAGVAALLLENRGRQKDISIFCLPPLLPSESEAREVEVSYRWPGMLNGLLNRGSESITGRVESAERIRKVEYTLIFEPELGSVTCKEVAGHGQLHRTVSEKGWLAWKFEMNNAQTVINPELICRLEARGGRRTAVSPA